MEVAATTAALTLAASSHSGLRKEFGTADSDRPGYLVMSAGTSNMAPTTPTAASR
jgi:hypothetical protein